jgi:hypothetical protein
LVAETLYCIEFAKNNCMMPNRSTDLLFQLIHSLEKAEKGILNFISKGIQLDKTLKCPAFDALEKMQDYDEKSLLKKLATVEKPQLANLKAHLYKQLLASLRLLKSADSIDLQLHEQLDYARILYNKGLYLQSLKILEKVKDLAMELPGKFFNSSDFFGKKIETLHITRSDINKASILTQEALVINERRLMRTRFSNLALQLYNWYVKNGHARNEKDEKGVKDFFKQNLPPDAFNNSGFYEQLYLYQSYCWYAFIRQDFIMYYRYSLKWVRLFQQHPKMIEVETGHFIKGMHNLLTANFDLRNFAKFDYYLKKFEAFAKTKEANYHDNFRMQAFLYLTSAKINNHLMKGSFDEGVKMVPEIESGLKEFELYIDRHRVLVIQYKTAMLFFGNKDYNACIDYLQKIINGPVDLRIDLQCYADYYI